MCCTYCLQFENFRLMSLETMVLQLSRCLAYLVSVAHLGTSSPPCMSRHPTAETEDWSFLENFVHHTMLYYILLYCTILYYTIYYILYTIYYKLYTMYSILYTILYYTILYYTILYYTILYYTILYYTILYYTILYYTILYYTIMNLHFFYVTPNG